MICYKDMTFCPFFEDCAKAKDCHRPLYEYHRVNAAEIGLPITHYASKPDCHEKNHNADVGEMGGDDEKAS